MVDMEIEKFEVEPSAAGTNNTGISKVKKIGFFVVGLCLCILVGVRVGFLIKSTQVEDDAVSELDVLQIIKDVNNDILPMSVDDSIEYIDGKIIEYNNSVELWQKFLIMKMNVYVNGDQPAGAIDVMSDSDDVGMDDVVKMEYYMAASKAYEAIGDMDASNNYYEKYFTIYNTIFSDGGGGE